MNDGDVVTLVTFGPFEVFAECTDAGNFRMVEIFLTSSEQGWFTANEDLLDSGEVVRVEG